MFPSRLRGPATAAVLALALILALTLTLSRRQTLADPGSPRRLRAGLDPKTVSLKPVVRPPAAAPSPPRALDWNDVDPVLRWPCGHLKCFFVSKSDPSRGYMLERGRLDGRTGGKHLAQYDYAVALEAQHGVRHFFAATPYAATMPEWFYDALASDAKDDPERHQHQRDAADILDHGDGARDIIVIENETAPPGSVIFKCEGDPYTGALDHVLRLGGAGAGATLLDELAEATAVLGSPLGRSLAYHFQAMLDPEGRIYHLDFDRRLDARGHFIGTRDAQVQETVHCLEVAMEHVRKTMV